MFVSLKTGDQGGRERSIKIHNLLCVSRNDESIRYFRVRIFPLCRELSTGRICGSNCSELPVCSAGQTRGQVRSSWLLSDWGFPETMFKHQCLIMVNTLFFVSGTHIGLTTVYETQPNIYIWANNKTMTTLYLHLWVHGQLCKCYMAATRVCIIYKC